MAIVLAIPNRDTTSPIAPIQARNPSTNVKNVASASRKSACDIASYPEFLSRSWSGFTSSAPDAFTQQERYAPRRASVNQWGFPPRTFSRNSSPRPKGR